jgi:hypothetical protein
VSEKKLELNLQILYKHQEKNESLVFTFREKIKDLTLYHDRKKKTKKKLLYRRIILILVFILILQGFVENKLWLVRL